MAAATKSYIVKTPVQHDDVRYEPGEPIELDTKTAEPLLAVHAIEPAPASAPETKAPGKKA